MNRTIIAAAFTVVFLVLFAFPFAATSHADAPGYKLPAVVNPSEKYLFFFHNYYVETKGPDGECKYYDLLKAFSGKGFTVISEIRPKDASVVEYAAKAAIKIRNMLSDGVPPENITVAGHSKGAVIALQVASLVEKPKVNYVIMAGCGIKGLEKAYPDYSQMQGNLLSVFATSDKVAGSCIPAFSRAKNVTRKEIPLDSAAGHQLFFKPADLWLDPVVAWLRQAK